MPTEKEKEQHDSSYFFYLDQKPIPQQRPRFTKVSSFTIAYDPQKKQKNIIRSCLKNVFNQSLIKNSIEIDFNFLFKLPTALSKNKKFEILDMPHTQKPDIDNLVKFYLDCLVGVILCDDCIVYKITAVKRWALSDGVEIKLQSV